MAATGTNQRSAQFRAKECRAFTLVELLVVICIIMILGAMLIGGVRHVHRIAATKETIAELHVCQGLLQEYENRNGLAGIEAYAGSPASQSTDPDSPLGDQVKFPIFVDPSPVFNNATAAASQYNGTYSQIGTYWAAYRVPDFLSGPNITGVTTMDTTAIARYQAAAVLDTRDVMYLLMRVPANRVTVQSIQPKRILEAAPGQGPISIDQGPILLDGWGNPIIFVPRGGIYLYVTDPSDPSGKSLFVVRSTGTFRVLASDPPLTGNERPFWASAGEDADFTQGEDNLYSFQQ